MRSTTQATITIIEKEDQTYLRCGGAWTLPHIKEVELRLKTLHPKRALIWDVSGITELDSAGVALWKMTNDAYNGVGIQSTLIGASHNHINLYSLLYPTQEEKLSPPKPPTWLYTLGRNTYDNIRGTKELLAFLGEAFVWLFYTLLHPSQIRYRSIVSHIFTTGAQALPIIAISAFLIGVVIAYQSIVQLQKFGADIFIVDTIGISLTRELAPLITAIVVAGRSGSAFTAQIGAMKMTQEIDAMKTMGFEPFTFLVWPRVFALMIVMPLLIFFADIIGIFGGMVIAQAQSNLSFNEFIHRLQGALALKHYLIGIIKGPFFAFLIAIVSTYRGFQVSSNTESIGLYTTKSVVNAIFLVIACDALFSILLTELKL